MSRDFGRYRADPDVIMGQEHHASGFERVPDGS
jgi:hypothetical protein